MAQLTSALRASFPLIRRRLGLLWFASAWPFIVMAVCFLVTGFVFRAHHESSQQADPLDLWHSMGAFAKIGVVLAYLASISLPNGFATAGAVVIVWADLHDNPVRLQLVVSRFRRVLPRLLAISLWIGVICTFGGMFLLLPGILGYAFLSFAIPVLMIEDTKVSTALRRGINLAARGTGAVLGLYAIVLAIVVAAIIFFFVAIGVISASEHIPWWVTAIGWWILFVFFASAVVMGTTVVVVQLYSDLCIPTGAVPRSDPNERSISV